MARSRDESPARVVRVLMTGHLFDTNHGVHVDLLPIHPTCTFKPILVPVLDIEPVARTHGTLRDVSEPLEIGDHGVGLVGWIPKHAHGQRRPSGYNRVSLRYPRHFRG